MAVPKKRTGHSAQGHRRSNWKATKPETTKCPNCGATRKQLKKLKKKKKKQKRKLKKQQQNLKRLKNQKLKKLLKNKKVTK